MIANFTISKDRSTAKITYRHRGQIASRRFVLAKAKRVRRGIQRQYRRTDNTVEDFWLYVRRVLNSV